MDEKLVAWARAVKSARRREAAISPALPVLWLFTDDKRLPDPRAAAARLPRGLAGIVLRHDAAPDRAALGRDLARICRARRLALVVAGDWRLAASLGAGVHLRGGFGGGSGRRAPRRLTTSSAHGPAQFHRAARAGADLIFLSPAFATASHPGAPALGAARWHGYARVIKIVAAKTRVAALGGIDGLAVRRLSRRFCDGVGAIGALA